VIGSIGQDESTLREAVVAWLPTLVVPDDGGAATLREAVVAWLPTLTVPAAGQGQGGNGYFATGAGWTGGALYRSTGGGAVAPTLREAVIAFLRGL
jgi:hypothetical protein